MNPGAHLSGTHLSPCNHLGQALSTKEQPFPLVCCQQNVVSRETTRGFLGFTWNMGQFSVQNIGALVIFFQLLGNSFLVGLTNEIETNLGDVTRNSSSPNPIE